MVLLLDRHLKKQGYSLSIICESEFISSKEVLDEKGKQLRFAGHDKLDSYQGEDSFSSKVIRIQTKQ